MSTNDAVIVAGVESMSRIPLGTAIKDGDPNGPSVRARYAPGLIPQGVSAELISDGMHVHESVVRATLKMFGAERIILISDALSCCGN